MYRMSMIFLFLFLLMPKNVQLAIKFALSMRYTNVTVRHNPVYFLNTNAWVEKGALFADLYSAREISHGYQILTDVQIKLSDSKQYQTLFSYNMDACKMMAEISKQSLLKYWIRNIQKRSNLPLQCPFKKGYFYIRNMTMEEGSIPAYLRPGDYRIIVHSYFGKLNTKKEKEVIHFVCDMNIF